MNVLSYENTIPASNKQPNSCIKGKSSNAGGADLKMVINGPLAVFFAFSTFFSPAMNHSILSRHNSVIKEMPSHTIQIEYAEHEVDIVYKDTDYMRLEQILHLSDDWNGYGAKRFTPTLVEKCQSIFRELPVAPHIYPTGRQSIQFQYELPDRSYLEFEIFEKRTICLLVPKRQYSCAETQEITSHEIERIKEMVIKFYE